MRLPPRLIRGDFVKRLNRFAALVRVNGRSEQVHVANSGRLQELFAPHRTVYLAPRPDNLRKTRYDLTLVDLDPPLVSVDARLPSGIVAEALIQGKLPQFSQFPQARREVMVGPGSRLDLLLSNGPSQCFVEVKSVTLVVKGTGMFPDAPTERGRRHVEHLVELKRRGHRAAIIFVIQRQDAERFAPHDDADPDFGKALRRAARKGVEVYAFRCTVTRRSITLAEEVPVVL